FGECADGTKKRDNHPGRVLAQARGRSNRYRRVDALVRAKEFDHAASLLAPLAGRGRKRRIAWLPGEGQPPPSGKCGTVAQGPLTPALSPPALSPQALSPQAGRGSMSAPTCP